MRPRTPHHRPRSYIREREAGLSGRPSSTRSQNVPEARLGCDEPPTGHDTQVDMPQALRERLLKIAEADGTKSGGLHPSGRSAGPLATSGADVTARPRHSPMLWTVHATQPG